MVYLTQRLLATLPTVLGVVTLAFLLIHIAPGDPAELMLGDYTGVTPQVLADMRARLGLDRPLPVQYVSYVTSVLRGDLGRSFRTNRPVLSEIAAQTPFTLILAAAGVAVAVLLGVPAGIVSALRRNTTVDYITTTVAMFWLASPSFWFAILLIYFLSYRLGWFPVFGAGTWGDWRSLALHLILPAAAIGVRSAALISRMTRSSMLEVLHQDYVRTARAKGLAERGVLWGHVLRNSAIPVVTVAGLTYGTILGGTVITESVFAWPGVGRLALEAVYNRDFPLVQATVFVAAFVFVVINFVLDLTYGWLDPRIRLR